MIVKDGENILTIHEAPYEDDAFEYAYDEDSVLFAIREEMKKGPVLGHFC